MKTIPTISRFYTNTCPRIITIIILYISPASCRVSVVIPEVARFSLELSLFVTHTIFLRYRNNVESL